MRKRLLAFLSALLMLLSSCAVSKKDEGNCTLYYLYADLDAHRGGDAIGREDCTLELSSDTLTAAEVLLTRYLQGPENEGLKSPLPASLQMQGLTMRGTTLAVDVSEVYSILSGIDLTLADSCLALTLAELPGVSRVSITVNGKGLDYRSRETLQPRQILISSTEDVVETLLVSLYYLDPSTGALAEERRELSVYEGQYRADALLAALLEGPEEDGHSALFPEDFSFLSTRMEEETCYVALDSSTWPTDESFDGETALQSAAKSLLSLAKVQKAIFIKDGETFAEFTL